MNLSVFDLAYREIREAMENNGVKLVCINYKKSDSGNKVKQKLLRKLGKTADNKQIAGVRSVHGVKTESVSQVSFNINYLVLLLKDGRVCRVSCTGNYDVAENGGGFDPAKESFQVASDLEYARVLQQQYDSEQSWNTLEGDRNYIRLSDPLSSSLYEPLPHMEHHGSINIPLFDPNPFEEEMATINPPFRARRHYNSPVKDYGRAKNFDKSSRSYPKFGGLEWLSLKQVSNLIVGTMFDGDVCTLQSYTYMYTLTSLTVFVYCGTKKV